MTIDIATQLRQDAQVQRARAPEGATVWVADQFDRAADEIDRLRLTDRDHFAAAALTGLLAQGDDGSFSEESYVRGAYRWADAMLREREQRTQERERDTGIE